MNAIYGIFGNGNLELLKLMGENLSHRGTGVIEWSPAPRVYFGGRSFGINHKHENNPDIPLIANASLYNGIEISESLELEGVISNPNSGTRGVSGQRSISTSILGDRVERNR